MKEYIEREAVLRIIDKYGCGNGSVLGHHSGAVDCAGLEIARIPAADVVEVRHGRWEKVIPTKSAAKWSTKVSCSQCHGQGYERYNYCPRANCCFVPYAENCRDVHRRHPQNIERLHEMRKVRYMLEKDGEILIFESEKAACEYLGVVKCSISSCYRRGSKCKGYKISKMDKEE